MTQQLILEPLGIITSPNKYGKVPAGAFSDCRGWYFRSPASMSPAPSPAFQQSYAIVAGSALHLFEVRPARSLSLAYMLAFYTDGTTGNSFVRWVDQADALADYSLALAITNIGQQTFDAKGRIYSISHLDRTIVNMARGHLVWDYAAPSSLAQATPRMCGLPPPQISAGSNVVLQSGLFGALGPGMACHAIAILRRKLPDGSELISPPNTAHYIYGSSTFAVNINYFATSLPFPYHRAGDVLEFYRTKSAPFSLTSSAQSVNTGSQYFLSQSYTLTTADEASTQAPDILDKTPDSGLGKEFYMNSGFSGPFGAAMPPPSAYAIATYKGHTFYGNITRVPSFTLSCPVYMGVMPITAPEFIRAAGIGVRFATGTTAVGSPVLSGVSAADLVGVKIGQVLSNGITGSIPLGAVVIAIGANSITFDQNATAVVVGANGIADVVVIDGVSYILRSVGYLAEQMHSFGGNFPYAICIDRIYPPGSGSMTDPETVPGPGGIQITRLIPNAQTTSMSVRATNGANYVPALPEFDQPNKVFSETAEPGVHCWSESGQPENCPISNTEQITPGGILGYAETRDALFIWCTDGLRRLSGTGGAVGRLGYNWRVDLVDRNLIPAGPQAWTVHRDTIYAYTNRGFVSIDSSGLVKEISEDLIGDVMPGFSWPLLNQPNAAIGNMQLVRADVQNDEIYICSDVTQRYAWLYNLRTERFTKVDLVGSSDAVSAIAFASSTQRMFSIGGVIGNTVVGLYRPDFGVFLSPTITFQPIYADNPFVMYHWQVVNVAFEIADDSNTVELRANGLSAGSRTPTSFGASGARRARFSVPRNAPAAANAIELQLNFTRLSTTTRLMGVAVDFETLTDQARRR